MVALPCHIKTAIPITLFLNGAFLDDILPSYTQRLFYWYLQFQLIHHRQYVTVDTPLPKIIAHKSCAHPSSRFS